MTAPITPLRVDSRSPPKGNDKSILRRRAGPRIPREGEDAEAMRLCAVILEVLGGVRTPLDAAAALGVSPPRYYALETRALGGLLQACRRRRKGPRKTPERELEKLRREVERLERDCSRSQALLRVTERAVGISAPPRKPEDEKPSGKKRRKRKPRSRALRAAKVLRAEIAKISVEPEGPKANDVAEVK